jgi:hypothetical protein
MTSVVDRFLSKHTINDQGCWIWSGNLDNGYGRFRIKDSCVPAHKFSYLMFVGAMPDGLQVDHLCRVKSCVNPHHLEAVTPKENTTRHRNTIKHCPNGHEYTHENIKTSDFQKYGRRGCRICHNNIARSYRQKKGELS